MVNWKITVTLFITLGILIAFLSSSPQVGNFFGFLGERLYKLIPEQHVDRNVSFLLEAGAMNITSEAKEVVIELEADNFTAELKNVNVESTGKIKIEGFTGTFAVKNNNLLLDGSFKKAKLEYTTLSIPQGQIKSSSAFRLLAIENLAMKELAVKGGKLAINNVETYSGSEIIISMPLGKFEFNHILRVEGKAAMIVLPEAKISVG